MGTMRTRYTSAAALPMAVPPEGCQRRRAVQCETPSSPHYAPACPHGSSGPAGEMRGVVSIQGALKAQPLRL
jgi:hypothetical protein